MCAHVYCLNLSAKNVSFPQKSSLMESGEIKHLHILNRHSSYLPVFHGDLNLSFILSQCFHS